MGGVDKGRSVGVCAGLDESVWKAGGLIVCLPLEEDEVGSRYGAEGMMWISQ